MALTLANRLGTSSHISPLLQKARRLGVHCPNDLEEIALARGLRYFGQPDQLADGPQTKAVITALDPKYFSKEELAIALMSPSLRMPQDIPELKEAFQRAIPTVREIIGTANT